MFTGNILESHECLSSFDVPSLSDASQRHPANSVAIPAGVALEASDRNAPCDPKSGHEFPKKNKARGAL
jgi:hypothetical protein